MDYTNNTKWFSWNKEDREHYCLEIKKKLYSLLDNKTKNKCKIIGENHKAKRHLVQIKKEYIKQLEKELKSKEKQIED